MASKKRKSTDTVTDRLFNEFYRFSFFRMVNLLESLFPEKEPLGQALEPGREAVRFSVDPGFVFPASDIAGLKHHEKDNPVHMKVSFMGMIGPSGLLPYWYNELALERQRHRDHTLVDFLNMFHHRLISLFYLAWKKHRLPENYRPGARDRLSQCFRCFIGLGTPHLREILDLPMESLIFYSGLMARQVPCVSAIKSSVEYFSDTPAEIEQFVNRTVPLDPEDRTGIGVTNSRLGMETVCGNSIWECQSKFLVRLGPMDLRRFSELLPSGTMLKPIFSLVKYMVGTEYEFEVGLVLERREVPCCVLGDGRSLPSLLGWSTWIKSPEFEYRDDPCVTFAEGIVFQNQRP